MAVIEHTSIVLLEVLVQSIYKITLYFLVFIHVFTGLSNLNL